MNFNDIVTMVKSKFKDIKKHAEEIAYEIEVRTEYLQDRKNEGDDMPKQQAQQTDIAQKAKDLFGEETVHVIDEE